MTPATFFPIVWNNFSKVDRNIIDIRDMWLISLINKNSDS